MDSKDTTKIVVKNISRNIVASIFNLGISILVSLVFPVFVIKVIGTEDYGLWVLWQSWLSIIQISLFGINTSILSILANLTQKSEEYWISFKSYAVACSSVALIITVISSIICGVNQAENIQFGLIAVLFLSFFLRILCELLILPSKTLQRYDSYYIQQNAYQLSFLTFSIILVAMNKSMVSLIISSFLSASIQFIFCYIYFLKSLTSLNYSLSLFVSNTSMSITSLREFRHLGKLDIINIIYSLGSNFAMRQIIPMISDLKGLSYYDLAGRVTSQVYGLAAIAFSNIIPSMTYLKSHSPDLFKSFIDKGHRYLTIVIIIILTFLVANSSSISLILFSEKIPLFMFILSMLALDGGINLTTGIYTNALLAIKDVRFIIKKLIYHIFVLLSSTFLSLSLFHFHSLSKYIVLITVGNILATFLFYLDVSRSKNNGDLTFSLIPWLKLLMQTFTICLISILISLRFNEIISYFIRVQNHFFVIVLVFAFYLIITMFLANLFKVITLEELVATFKKKSV